MAAWQGCEVKVDAFVPISWSVIMSGRDFCCFMYASSWVMLVSSYDTLPGSDMCFVFEL